MEKEIWDFRDMLYHYLRYEYALIGDEPYDRMPWSTQIELKRLQSVVYAFTGQIYNLETKEGRNNIVEAFNSGFKQGLNTCDESQLMRLQAILPQKYNYFARFRGGYLIFVIALGGLSSRDFCLRMRERCGSIVTEASGKKRRREAGGHVISLPMAEERW